MPTYEPGLGCPHCSDAFYRPEQRAEHIRTQHPGEYSGPTDDMVMLAQRAHVTLGDIFSDRRHGTDQGPEAPAAPEHQAKILQMPRQSTVARAPRGAIDSELYEHHLAWSKENGHGHNPDTITALRAHEKSGGLTRTQANKVADLSGIGGGDTNWRSQRHRDEY